MALKILMLLSFMAPISFSFGYACTEAAASVDKSHVVQGNVSITNIDEAKAFQETATYLEGDLTIDYGMDGAMEISFPKLTGVKGNIMIGGGAVKGTLRMENLIEVKGMFIIASASYPNWELTGIYLPKFVTFETSGEINALSATSIANPAQDFVVGNEEIKLQLFPNP